MLTEDRDDGFASPLAAANRWDTIESLPRPSTLDQLLSQAVDCFADEFVLDFFDRGEMFTFEQFDALVDRLAFVLSDQGVGEGTHVGLLLPNVPLYPAAFFALVRLGAVFVPINARLTATEIDHVCSEAEVGFIVAHRSLLVALDGSTTEAAIGPARIAISGPPDSELAPDRGLDLDQALADAPTGGRYPRPRAASRDLVSILFTSGSTGLPKGCMLSHEYWLILAQCTAELTPGVGRELLDTPFSYMMGPLGLVTALWDGRTLVVGERPTLRGYVARIREQRIDFAWFPEVLLKSPPAAGDRDHGLRRAFVESLPDDGYRNLEQRFGVTARACYGMTEIGLGTVVPWDDEQRGNADIGIAAPFRECLIVDAQLEPVPAGVVGELCVRGAGIFLGYYGRDDANADSFFGEGWYRTGDLVLREGENRFHYVGRAKAIVRRAGEQISAQEVENALLALPEIASAAVVAVPDSDCGEEVKAYVVLADGGSPREFPPERVLAGARKQLAPFKVPRYLEYRDHLPRTASEKVAKPALLEEKADLRQGSYDRVDGIWR